MLGTEGVKDAIAEFDGAYVYIYSFQHSSAYPRLDANPISKMNACRRRIIQSLPRPTRALTIPPRDALAGRPLPVHLRVDRSGAKESE